jgi:O-antigen/teichoic acid export membrane protein
VNTLQRTAKNMLALATGQAAYRLGLVALEVLLARSVAPAQFGEYAAAMGFAAVALAVMDLGVALGLVRVVARQDPVAPAYFGSALVLRAGIGLVVFPAMVGLSWWLHPPSRVPLVALLGLFVVVSSLQEVLASVHQGLGEMEWIAVFRLAIVAATAGGVGMALASGASLPVVTAAFPVAGFAGLSLWLAVTSRRLPPRFERGSLGPVLRDTALYGGMYVCSLLTFRQGIVVLSLFRGGVEVAGYAAGYRLLEVASKIPLVLSMALVPLMFRSAQEDPARLDRLFRGQVRLLGLGVFPLAAGVAIFAPEIVRAIYGVGYEGAVPVLRVFAAALPLSFLTGALGDMLTARDLQPRRTRIYASVLVVGLAANLVLAWSGGPVGSATAFLLTQAVLFALLLRSLRGGVTAVAPLAKLPRPLLAVALAGAPVAALHGRVHPALLAAAFLAAYAGFCLALGAIRPSEVRRLATALAQPRS